MQQAPDREIKYKDFTSLDFDRYRNVLAPFQDKVYQQETPLSEQELESVNNLEKELLDNYSRESLDRFEMVEEIIGIRERDYILKYAERYRSLCKEYADLWSEYDKKKEEGTLTPEGKETIMGRLKEIRPFISDSH